MIFGYHFPPFRRILNILYVLKKSYVIYNYPQYKFVYLPFDFYKNISYIFQFTRIFRAFLFDFDFILSFSCHLLQKYY